MNGQIKFVKPPTPEQIAKIRKAVENKESINSIVVSLNRARQWIIKVAIVNNIPIDPGLHLPRKKQRPIHLDNGMFNVYAQTNWLI